MENKKSEVEIYAEIGKRIADGFCEGLKNSYISEEMKNEIKKLLVFYKKKKMMERVTRK